MRRWSSVHWTLVLGLRRHINCTLGQGGVLQHKVKGSIMAKTKSMKTSDGRRKLASDHGRAKAKSGGEPQKKTSVRASRRIGSSKQRKG
jgi:hypothetical protein